MQTVGLFGLVVWFWLQLCLLGILCMHSNGGECPVCPVVYVCGYFCWWSSSGGMEYTVLYIWHSGCTEVAYTYAVFVLLEILCISGKE